MIEWPACHYAWHFDWLGNGKNTKKAGKTVENATYKHFDSNIRLAYVKFVEQAGSQYSGPT